ncbi:hypothetical protein THOM_1179 [Trachipleistophora hominis]|uniref:Uncharacterized protein n=1 Tax=Trachipleistophora hominis TaxID=72359 RepID=L7JX34_TRAHO|nr:hypothetical protein THOM_1179 [Trachipleistophora hominis]
MKKNTIIVITAIATIIVMFILLLYVSHSMLRAVDNKYKTIVDKKLNESAELRNMFLDGNRRKNTFLGVVSATINNETKIELRAQMTDKNYSKFKWKFENLDNDEDRYREWICGYALDPRPFNFRSIPPEKLAKYKLLAKKNIFVRIAAKLFRNFSVCIVDRHIEFILHSVPNGKRNIYIILVDEKRYMIYRFYVDDKEKTVKFNDKMIVMFKDDNALPISYGLISALNLAREP